MFGLLASRSRLNHSVQAEDFDPYWGDVQTLAVFTGGNGDTAYRDLRDGYPWIIAGNTAILAGTSVMNNGFGTQDGFLWTDGSGDLASRWLSERLGDADFTIEVLLAPSNGGAGAAYGRLAQIGPNSTNGGLWWVRSNNPNPLQLFAQLYASGYTNCINTPANTITNDQFVAVALTRQGNTYYMFYDGVLVGTLDNTNATAHNIVQTDLHIGGNSSNSENFRGRYNNLRITKGVARYTASYTPQYKAFPAKGPATADPNWWNVVSLLPLSGVAGATSFPDAKGRIWSVAGNAQISAVSKFGKGSLALDGSGDYLRCDDVARALAGHDTFTIELWVQSTQQMTDIGNLLSFNDSSGSNRILWQDSALFLTSANAITYPFLPVDGQFHHLALVCNAGTYTVFVDGVSQGSAVNSTRISGADRCSLGQEFDSGTASGFFKGYFEQLRATKGVARYTANFTPPTVPFADSVTVSLLHFDGAVGTSNITDAIGLLWSTTIAPAMSADSAAIGGLSCRFTGGAYIENTSSACWGFLHNGSSFTLEGFVTVDAIGATQAIVTNNGLSSANTGIGVWVDSAGALQLMVSRGVSTVPTVSASVAGAFTAGARVHLVVQYDASGNTYTIYLDGVQVWSGAPAQAFSTSAPTDALRIARNSSGSNAYSLTGNYDEWRITSGKARYTANFSPPTTPYSS